ncbi:hypothetical protein RSAG8_06133, partial [Rhizoctonia solani AG-8 WAC10335]
MGPGFLMFSLGCHREGLTNEYAGSRDTNSKGTRVR